MKKILILSTGGTIASSETDKGLAPKYQVGALLEKVPEVKQFCEVYGKPLMSLDSTNMQPENWIKIAEAIYENYNDYDGFVVSHGTDTMAYTSSALSYMLQNLDKPVVLTGSQKTIEDPMGDAKRNLIDALRFAAEGVNGVYIVFDGKVINGTRAVKVKSKSYDAFKSINYPYIAYVKGNYVKFTGKAQPVNVEEDLTLYKNLCSDVLTLKLIPGTKPEIFKAIKKMYKGVVIESFGNGGLPFKGRNLLSGVKELIQEGVAVVLTTQCLIDGTSLEVYEVGQKVKELDVIEGKDMTTEAIVTKLMWALGQTQDIKKVKTIMQTPVCNDITI